MNFEDELMMNKWKKILPASNQTGKSPTYQRGVLDNDCVMLKVVLQLVFFFLN